MTPMSNDTFLAGTKAAVEGDADTPFAFSLDRVAYAKDNHLLGTGLARTFVRNTRTDRLSPGAGTPGRRTGRRLEGLRRLAPGQDLHRVAGEEHPAGRHAIDPHPEHGPVRGDILDDGCGRWVAGFADADLLAQAQPSPLGCVAGHDGAVRFEVDVVFHRTIGAARRERVMNVTGG